MSDEYMLVNCGLKCVSLISTTDGNRFREHTEVELPTSITIDELKNIINYSENSDLQFFLKEGEKLIEVVLSDSPSVYNLGDRIEIMRQEYILCSTVGHIVNLVSLSTGNSWSNEGVYVDSMKDIPYREISRLIGYDTLAKHMVEGIKDGKGVPFKK